MPPRDDRPFFALAGVLLLVGVLLAVPPTRAWLSDNVLDPVRAQADPQPGLRGGYSVASLAAWALAGLAFAWAAHELVFVRLGYEPGRRFFLGLAPWLLVGPLAHALLAADALPAGSAWAYLAAEPPVYLSVAVLAVGGLWLGRAVGRPFEVPLGVGLLALLPLLVLAAPRVAPASLPRLGAILLLAAAPALLLAWAFHRWRRDEPLDAVAAVVGAHALDGATTWMVLRDPFGLGFETFAEKNPVSLRLVETQNGWPYFALKLALPLVLLSLVKAEEGEERTKAFLLFAVFVLGYGPGMSNLLQVMLA